MGSRIVSGERILPAEAGSGLNKTADLPGTRLGGGTGRVYLFDDLSLWIGRGSGRGMPHDHHAVQITFCVGSDDEAFSLHAVDRPRPPLRFAIVPAHLRHVFDGRGARIAHIFVAPESRDGRALAKRYGSDDVVELSAAECASTAAAMAACFFGADRDEGPLLELARAFTRRVAGTEAITPLDARIATVRAYVKQNMARTLSLAEAASAANLSSGRLRHLFVAETGTTFRAYVVWQRLQRATDVVMKGGTWTEAAHATGFADSAHLSRSFRRMFGVSPATIVPDEAPALSAR
jgi:AraC-like DNA-binding protein